MIHYRNLDAAGSFSALAACRRVRIAEVLSPERIGAFSIQLPEGFFFNYAAAPVDTGILDALQALADEQQLVEKFQALASGEVMNTGEGRMVLHHLARGSLAGTVLRRGPRLRSLLRGRADQSRDFAAHRALGRPQGLHGQAIPHRRPDRHRRLGPGSPRALPGPRAMGPAPGPLTMEARFISNVDPDDADLRSEGSTRPRASSSSCPRAAPPRRPSPTRPWCATGSRPPASIPRSTWWP